ncbi:WXG100 family type VII secretion target [Arthrobacter sp. M4]|uniref:WXG100 family type VII secretion target n=1 Tax=Arthrobacter sp. M4 TaxID=218160 RepID=UPI001CDC0D8C|nr:WXG100 family type VII secretion target [Arthrobacter sp. M4]MCA4133144.1 WXG100 family type VII secretion target [Arthrobacter sp. M4]
MALYGADVEQLRALSKALAAGSTRISGKVRELDSLISHTGYWHGQDAQQFADAWQTQLRKLMDDVSRKLADAAKTAMLNADEQSNASESGGQGASSVHIAAAPGAPAVQPGQDPPKDRLTPQEILDKYQVSDARTTEWPSDWDPLRLVVDQRTVTEKEAELLNGLGPLEMNAFKDIHDDAFEAADQRFPSPDQNDDQNDAFRHAYWNALMVREYGADWAEDYATAHEQLPGNPGPREAMDLYNNEVGRKIAIEHPDAEPEELANLVEQAVRNGDTVVVGPDLLPHPSNEVPMERTGDANNAPPAPGHDPKFNDESRTTS